MPAIAQSPRTHSAITAFVAGALLLASTGCGNLVVPAANQSSGQPVAGRGFGGSVHGGNQPVSGASIQLYAPGTSGYGSASIPLLAHPVTTNAQGNFSLTGDYTCPSSGTPVYLVVVGGNPGLAPGTTNPVLAMMGLLGYCGDLSPNSYFVITELTTVASAFALAPFMKDYSHVGTTVANVQGLFNAFAAASTLADMHSGVSPGQLPSFASIPLAKIDSLGDILTSCVNSNGSTTPTASCGRLFAAVTPSGGAAPKDTIGALLDIAANPGHNVGAIYNAYAAVGPYQPTLSAPPSDWTLTINYASSAFKTPTDLAIDSQGNVWVLSTPAMGSRVGPTVTIFNSYGIVGSYPQPGMNFGHLALDVYDNPWLTDTLSSEITELNSSGTRATVNPFSGGGINGPGPIAFDPNGNAWVGNSGNTVSELSPNGAPLSPFGYPTGAGSGPSALALDASGNAWVTDSSGSSVSVLSNHGALLPGSPFSGAGLNGPYAIAMDATGSAWIVNRTGSSLSKFTSPNAPAPGSPFYGAGMNAPVDVAIDGAGSVWLANSGSNSVSQFLSNGRPQSGSSGYGSGILSNPFRLAIDSSGSVWVANLGSTSPSTSSITRLVGVAAPVVTPLSLAVQNKALGQRP